MDIKDVQQRISAITGERWQRERVERLLDHMSAANALAMAQRLARVRKWLGKSPDRRKAWRSS